MPLPGAVGLTDRPDELRELTGAIASALGRTVRRAGNRLERLVDRDPYHVAPYRGYGTARRVLVQGRVLEDEGLQSADPARSDWRNLLDALRRLESDPLPHARLRAHAGGAAHELVADDEGFFRQWIDLPETLAPGTAGMASRLARPREYSQPHAQCQCPRVGAAVRRGLRRRE
jgi:hypothetical protein